MAGLPWLAIAITSSQSAPATIDFARDIAPILKSKCANCHGADAQSGGMRLDTVEGIRKGGVSGQLYLPFESGRSIIVRRLLGQDDKPRMPMGFAPLSDDEVAKIRAWIDHGAVLTDPAKVKHWAYVAPVRPPWPTVKNRAWARNAIDRFVLARLEKEGVLPSPEASKETLARRASLDLTGLPPTVDELEAFLADKKPGAYERCVDRLLASPHYGERMARIWLDLARYADTNGYEKDLPRKMWPWRDWVINAFNQNMPYDRFTIEQLAGDLLPNPTREQLVATGFHRNSMLNDEGGIDPEEFRVIGVIDRVETTATTWLGSTLACAQCHNHKYDPFTQKDYYSFFAFFNRSEDNGRDMTPLINLPDSGQERDLNALESDITKTRISIAQKTPVVMAEMPSWEATLREGWQIVRPEAWATGATLTVLPDNSILASGADPAADLYTVTILFHASDVRLPPDNRSVSTWRSNVASPSGRCVPEASSLWNLRQDVGDTHPLEAGVTTVFSADSSMRKPIEAQVAGLTSGITGVRIEAIPDRSLPNGSSGRNVNGNFVLRNVEAKIVNADGTERVLHFRTAKADFSQQDFNPQSTISDGPGLGWAIAAFDAKNRVIHTLSLSLQSPLKVRSGDRLVLTLRHQTKYPNHNLGRFRIALTSDPDLAHETPPTAAQSEILKKAAEARTKEETKLLADYYSSVAPGLGELKSHLMATQKKRDDLVARLPTVMVMKDLPKARPNNILKRGDFRTPGEPVVAATPVVMGGATSRTDRLGLARWLVNSENPLTARVEVNRLWEQCFGRGIVATPEDFGTQGEPPSHPELLDWLATELMARKWDMKAILRLIVTSSTYRQSSRVSEAMMNKDPYNVLLGRGPRFRVEAETVRDIALTASGLLTPTIGGPSVMPPQPPGIWENSFSFYDTKERWVDATGPNRYRRGMYTYWRRTAPYPMALTFDLKSRDMCVAHRSRTNSPLQALNTLNDPVFVECAGKLGLTMANRGLAYGFLACTSRKPKPREISILAKVYEQALASFRANTSSAAKLLLAAGIGGKGQSTPENAAWVVVANTILNLDETITKD